MSEARPWLPWSALGDARTAEPVACMLAEWSAAWAATVTLVAPPRWEPCPSTTGTTGYALLGHGNGYRLLLREDMRLDLAALLLGCEIGERECRTWQDRVVLEHLVDVAISALAESLASVLTSSVEQPADEWYALPISCDGASLLRLEAARPILVALALSWAGPARREGPLWSWKSALADQSIKLSAQVGTSQLALAEIEALEVGDVLALDTPLSALIAACINGELVGDGALSLAPGDGDLKLQIERPASQW